MQHEEQPQNLAMCFLNRSPQKLMGLVLLLKERGIPFQTIVDAGVMDVFYSVTKQYGNHQDFKYLTDHHLISKDNTYGPAFDEHIDKLDKVEFKPTNPRLTLTKTQVNIRKLRSFFPSLFGHLLIQSRSRDRSKPDHFQEILDLFGGGKVIPVQDSMFKLIEKTPSYFRYLLSAVRYDPAQLVPFFKAASLKTIYQVIREKDSHGVMLFTRIMKNPHYLAFLLNIKPTFSISNFVDKEMWPTFIMYLLRAIQDDTDHLMHFFKGANLDTVHHLMGEKDNDGVMLFFHIIQDPQLLDLFLSAKPCFSVPDFIDDKDERTMKHIRLAAQNPDTLITLLLHYPQFQKSFPILDMMKDQSFADYIHQSTEDFQVSLKLLLPKTTFDQIFKAKKEEEPFQMKGYSQQRSLLFTEHDPLDVPLLSTYSNLM